MKVINVVAYVMVIELSWTKGIVFVIVIVTLSDCNYSITFLITSENENSPNESIKEHMYFAP